MSCSRPINHRAEAIIEADALAGRARPDDLPDPATSRVQRGLGDRLRC